MAVGLDVVKRCVCAAGGLEKRWYFYYSRNTLDGRSGGKQTNSWATYYWGSIKLSVKPLTVEDGCYFTVLKTYQTWSDTVSCSSAFTSYLNVWVSYKSVIYDYKRPCVYVTLVFNTLIKWMCWQNSVNPTQVSINTGGWGRVGQCKHTTTSNQIKTIETSRNPVAVAKC